MVSIYGMTQSEAVGEQRGPQQYGMIAECHHSPDPDKDIDRNQYAVDAE